jgi:flagellar capping protein FliD
MLSCSNSQDSNMGAGPSAEAPTEARASLWIAPALLGHSSTEFTLEGQMSPRTVATTLAQFPNLDSNVLRGICKGLCETLEYCAASHVEQTGALQDQIQTLESTLHDCTNDHETLTETLQEHVEILEQQLNCAIHPSPDDIPEGFSLNDGRYPMLYITVVPREM